ncbi:DUF3035 domain-containing protein [Lichenicoccus sp.]|uniref:DUF3035 domain-containing protein n=1 Tax=Lichenicoccus sp. TaxID=2781899 RepID=UPI003D144AC8
MRTTRPSARPRVRASVRPAALSGVLACALLAGCSGHDIERDFGLVRDAPDEYTVTTRAPLSMPPQSELPNPQPGAPRPQEQSSRLEAEETLAPDVALQGDAGTNSAGQSALVASASAKAAAPVGAGHGELDQPGTGFVNELMFWHGGRAGSVVDAGPEKQRLEENAALGRPPTDGATPTRKISKPGWFGGQ